MELSDSDAEPPWPGKIRLPGGVVLIGSCALWGEHEAYAAPCWIDRDAGVRDDRNAAEPTLAQLLFALQKGLIAAAPEVESTSSVLAVDSFAIDARHAALQLVGSEVELAATDRPATLARSVVALEESRLPWRQILWPCVPRSGRGSRWPAVRERRSARPSGEPLLLDRGDEVVSVHRDGEWTLIASQPGEHPIGWVASAAVGERDLVADELNDDSAELPWGRGDPMWSPRVESEFAPADVSATAEPQALQQWRTGTQSGAAIPALAGARRGDAAQDAELIEAVLGLARAAIARLLRRDATPLSQGEAHGAADLAGTVPDRVAALLEAWHSHGLDADPRLASCSALDLVVLALAAAPELDRSTARSYRQLGGPPTAGLVADLACTDVVSRVRVFRRLARDQPLRGTETVRAGSSQIPNAETELSVADWVVAALYGLVARGPSNR